MAPSAPISPLRRECSVCGWDQVGAWPVRSNVRARYGTRPRPLPSLDECRKLLAGVPRDPTTWAHDQHTAYMQAVMGRWPEVTPSQALFIVRALVPELR